MKDKSIRFKIIFLYTSILGVILVFFSIYPIYTVHEILRKRGEETMLVKAKQINDYFNMYTITSQKDTYAASLLYHLFMGETIKDKKTMVQLWKKETDPLGLENDFYRVRNLKGQVILRSFNLNTPIERNLDIKFANAGNSIQFAHATINGTSYRMINYPITFSTLNKLNLQMASPTIAQSIVSNMVFSCLGGIVIILFLGTFIAKYLTRQVLQPVEDVSRAAKDISQKNLNIRISIKEYDKEIKELVESFNEMIGRLGKSFAYVNDFNSHVSHEMKTPLAVIKGELELALEGENTKEEHEKVMKTVLEEVYKLIKIIKDMLLLAEFEYKPDIFKMEEIELTQFLKEVFQHSKLLADGKNINLKLSVENEPIWIKGDTTHLRRVFFNLIHNAVKFTPQNGEIKIIAQVIGKHVAICVKDTGIGIALVDQPRIFEKFYRVRPVDQDTVEGNGLGLSIARAIAKAHKGDIAFESEINKGSTFKVSLPVVSN